MDAGRLIASEGELERRRNVAFLRIMDVIAGYQNMWITQEFPAYAGVFSYLSIDELRDHFDGFLKQAGRHILLDGTEWEIEVSLNPRTIKFVPKNGQAKYMLQRYDDLYLERELCSGF